MEEGQRGPAAGHPRNLNHQPTSPDGGTWTTEGEMKSKVNCNSRRGGRENRRREIPSETRSDSLGWEAEEDVVNKAAAREGRQKA